MTTAEAKRLTKADLEALDTDEARAELDRRKANKRERGKAYAEKSQAEVDTALDDILSMFESGDLPDAVAQTVIRRQEGDAPVGGWSLMNQLIVLLSRTTDARGPRQWAQVGRTVKKGARPIFILGPKVVRFKDTDEETGEEVTRTGMRGFVGIPVYAVEDTEGDPLPEPADYTPATMPPLFDVAERLGVDVRWTGFSRDYRGYFAPDRNEIVLCTSDERTFFHELAHAAHREVLKAKGTDIKGGQVASQEIVAETCAATLCRLFDLDGYIYHGAEYVAAYAKATGGDLRRKTAKLLGEIQATLAVILDNGGGNPPAATNG